MPLTPADIPEELFPDVLKYVGTDDSGQITTYAGRVDLMSCSLVCLFWAKHFRDALFRHRVLNIKSLSELQTLQSYELYGSKRLTSLSRLCLSISVEQRWDSPAWCYRMHNSPLRSPELSVENSRDTLILRGPIPLHWPRAAYTSPHWSLPRTLTPAFLPFYCIRLCNIHFSHLSDLRTLLSHLSSVQILHLESLTWTSSASEAPAPLRRSNWKHLLRSVSANECTSNPLVCALLLNSVIVPSDAPFAHIDEREAAGCVALLRAISETDVEEGGHKSCHSFYICNNHRLGHRLLEQFTSAGQLCSFLAETKILSGKNPDPQNSRLENESRVALHFICDQFPESRRVIGLKLIIHESRVHRPSHPLEETPGYQWRLAFLPWMLKTLESAATTFPHLRLLEVQANLNLLRHAAEVYPEIAQLAASGGQPLHLWVSPARHFAPDTLREELIGKRNIIVDPLTLMPSHRQWGDLPLLL